MFTDAYITIEHGKAAELLDKLNKKLDGSPFDPVSSRILSHALPFYNGYDLYEISDLDSHPKRTISFILSQNQQSADIIILDGTNEPIYALNKSVPIFLNQNNIISYVKFFFFYVSGRFGRFNIIENVDEINWREEPVSAGRKALSKMITPLTLKEEDAQGIFHLTCSLIFKDSLFESDIAVQENGTVSLSNQEMLVEDMPIIDDGYNF